MPIRTGLLLTLFLIPFLIFPQETGELKEKKLEWEAVDGAAFYLVEIESEGIIIYSIRTVDPFLPLFLNPGEYAIRISIFNKFEKLASRSDWKPLRVYPSPQPIIETYEPDFFYNDQISITLTIEGSDFDASCLFTLTNGKDRIAGRETHREIRGSLISCEVVFTDSLLPEIGFWDLAVENPSGKVFTKDSAVKFGPRAVPEITSMTPSALNRGVNPGKILIRGHNFSSRGTIHFEGPSEVPYTNLEIYYGEEITFYLDPESMLPGSYRVTVENEGDLTSEPFAFTLEDERVKMEEEIRQKRENSTPFFGAEYHVSFPMGEESSELFNTSPLGLSLRFREKFRNNSVYSIPVLREMGFAAGFHYTYYSDAIADFVTVAQFHLDGGLFYLSDWDIPVNLYVFMGFGSAYTLFYFEDDRFNHSFDFSNRLEIGGQYEFKGLKYEAGLSFAVTHFQKSTFTALNPYIMVGWSR